MHAQGRQRMAWATAAVGLGVVVTVVVLRQLVVASEGSTSIVTIASHVAWGVTLAAFVISGAMIASHQPGNVIGWLLMIPGLSAGISELGLIWLSSLDPVPTAATLGLWLVVWVVNWAWVLLIFPIFLILILLPSGRLLSPRWRWVVALLGLMTLVMIGLSAFAGEMALLEMDEEVWAVPNPIGFIAFGPEFDAAFGAVWGPLLAIVTAASVAAFVIRYRRGSSVERHQLKWPLWAVVVFGLGYGSLAIGTTSAEGTLGDAVFALSLCAVPISIAVAVLKYRLFDIDRIISRTVSYALVVGSLVGVFFLLVTTLSTVLPNSSDLAVAGSTLAVAALFNPLRQRVQRTVDRRFNRSGYDTERVLGSLATDLQGRVDSDRIVEEWLGVVSETMQPAALAVWVRDGDHHG